MKYAVNIADCTMPDYRLAASILLAPVKGATVDAEQGRFDGMAVGLDCDEGRALAIVQVLHIKARPHELRCYESTNGQSWRKI